MVKCKKCKREIKDKGWPVENTGGLCPDCAFEDFREKIGKEDEETVSFEMQLTKFSVEYDEIVEIADDEDRFLTTEELRVWEQRLQKIWETHIKNTGQEKHLETFKQCFSCQNRNTPTDPLITIGVIRCQNQDCEHHEKFNEMFNTVYTKHDIDRAKEHMDKTLKTPEEYTPVADNISGEMMQENTELKQKDLERDKESKNRIYA